MSRILGVLGPLRSRLIPKAFAFHTHYSLASRIQALLPDLGESPFEEPRAEAPPTESIPEYLSRNQYLEASKSFASATSMNTFQTDFAQLIEPHVRSSFSLEEVQYYITQLGLGALTQDKDVEKDFRVIKMLQNLAFEPREWDMVLTASMGIHFPQILWSNKSSVWLKTKIMHLVLTKADEGYAETSLRRYIGQLDGYDPVLYLARHNFPLVSKIVLEKSDTEHMVAVVDLTTRKNFQLVSRRILAKKDLSPRVLEAALQQAINLKLSYEIAKICKHGQGRFPLSLLKRALLAVAWGQRQPHGRENNDDSFTTAQHVKTQNINTVLKSIPESMLPRVVYKALLSPLAPNILWGLVLSWDESGLGTPPRNVYMRTAQMIVERPHFEQLRYMALESTPSAAISQLLKLNVQRVHKIRLKSGIKPETMIDDIDMKLFIGGMVLLSEKVASSPTATPDSPETSTRAFGAVVDQMFLQWSPEQAQATINSLCKYHSPSPQVTLTMVGMLLRHKSYTQAVQLLHTQSTAELPPTIFYRLLLQVCSDFPQISTILTTWLTSVLRVYLPPSVLQRMVVLLSRQRELSDRQSMLRINSVLKLLRGQKASLGPDAAAAIVDGLLDRAMTRPGGSRNRLQWALDLCKEEGVPQEKVKEWVDVINSMRRDGKGYWHKRHTRH